MQLMLGKKELLDALFDESDTVGAIDVVGEPSPGNQTVCIFAYLAMHLHVYLLCDLMSMHPFV